MGVLDFLFEGNPPPNTTTGGSSTENIPQWLSDYTQGLIARANAVAGEGYIPYTGPRVAGLNQDQLNAFDVVRNNIGGWNDEVGQAGQTIQGGLTQAMPYFGKAGESTPEAVQRYMDPYVGNVIDRAKLEANRNWEENLMPSISARFIRGGQPGSTAHQELLQRGARDVTEGLNSQSLAALSGAFNTAGSQFATDAARFGNLGSAIGSLGIQGGQALGNLGQLESNLNLRDAAALQGVGETEQNQAQRNLDTAYGDFQAQRDYPRQQVDWLNSIIKGVPHDTSGTTTSTGPASQYQPSLASQLISLYGLWKDIDSGDGKAEGGRVGYSEGGIVGPLSQGIISHIPGPAMGRVYDRYARGGHVRRGLACIGV